VHNPKADGHCGFRALALALGMSEDDHGMVKAQMHQYYISRKAFYVDELGYNHNQLIAVLQDNSIHCPTTSWFYVPDCAQLAADTFGAVIVFLDMGGTGGESCMYLPLGPFVQTAVPIGLSLSNEHFKCVKFNSGGNFPWPRLNPQHEPIRRKFNFVDLAHVYSNPFSRSI
jgi:hypothetical protein